MTNTEIYLDLDADARELLADYGLTIADLLEESGIEAKVRHAQLPGSDTRDLVAVVSLVAASGVAAVSLAGAAAIVIRAISDAFDRKARRQVKYVQYLVPEVVRDAAGNPLLDKEGQAQTTLRPVHEYLYPNLPTSGGLTVESEQGRIVVRMGVKEKD